MKYLILCVYLFLSALISHAQCIPDTSITHNIPGTYPDSATGLPHSHVGVPYSTVIQVKVLTTYLYLGTIPVPIDSVSIDNVSGLPPGFSYSCTPSNCNFPGGSDACITLTGPAPGAGMVGTYSIVVNVTGYGNLGGTPISNPDVIDDYAIVIDTATAVGTINKLTFSLGQNIPNPANEITVIPIVLTHPDDVSLTISNVIGKRVFRHTYSLQKGKTNIPVDLHDLLPGIYLYTLSTGSNSVTRRMIISND